MCQKQPWEIRTDHTSQFPGLHVQSVRQLILGPRATLLPCRRCELEREPWCSPDSFLPPSSSFPEDHVCGYRILGLTILDSHGL